MSVVRRRQRRLRSKGRRSLPYRGQDPAGGGASTFGILYETERNSGNDVRRAGEEGLFEMLREQNKEAFEAVEFSRIFTTDPHSLNTLRHEYDLDQPVSH